MGNKKNIDKLFQEKFRNFEAAPNDAMWDSIRSELDKEEEDRRIIPFWMNIGNAPYVLSLLFLTGIFTIIFKSDIVQNSKGEENLNNHIQSVNDVNKVTENHLNQYNSTDVITGKNNNLTPYSVKESQIDLLDDSYVFDNQSKMSDQSSFNPTNNQFYRVVEENNKSGKANDLRNTTSQVAGVGNYKTKSNTVNSIKERERLLLNSNSLEEKIAKKEYRENKNIGSGEKMLALNSSSKEASVNGVYNTESSNVDRFEKTFLREEISDSLRGISKAEISIVNDEKEIVALDSVVSPEIKEQDKKLKKRVFKKRVVQDKKEELPYGKWRISPVFAPVYYGSLGEGSSIDNRFKSNAKKGDITASYGIRGEYFTDEKLSFRVGVNRLKLGYSTEDVLINSSAVGSISAKLAHVSLSSNAMSLNIVNEQGAASLENSSSLVKSVLSQDIRYLEIPIGASYQVLDKKIGINIIGGFSTFFLGKNELYADVDGQKIFIGKANNLNKMSYSANIGFGLDYKIAKKLTFNIEPMFKYQLNTYSDNTGDFRPYVFGVYSGFSYKF